MSGQSTAQVPKSDMWVYDSSRAIVASISLSFFRKIGPWEGSRYSTSEREDSLQAGDEIHQARAVVGVDHADAAVAEDVVAGKEQVAHPQRELAVGVARACSRPPASCRRSSGGRPR